jgi:hypothetical protein
MDCYAEAHEIEGNFILIQVIVNKGVQAEIDKADVDLTIYLRGGNMLWNSDMYEFWTT